MLIYIFAQQKEWTLLSTLNLIIPFIISFQATHAFAPRALIFKLQQEVLKFSSTCVSWCSPKIDLWKNF